MKRTVLIAVIILAFVFFNSLFAATSISKPNWRFDHIVIVVDNVNKASADFTQLGFTVSPATKMNNPFFSRATIPLPDGTYIELLGPKQINMISELKTLKMQNRLNLFTDNLNAIETRMANHIAQGEGIADFAFYDYKLDLNSFIIEMDDQGVNLLGPVPMKSVNAGNRKILWDVAVPESESLPLFISDITPRALRTNIKIDAHKNGVTGIARITIAVKDIEEAGKIYQEILGAAPVKNPTYTPPENVKIAVFKMGAIDIILAQPIDKNGPLFDYLNEHGDGPYRIAFYTNNKSLAGKLNPSLTHKTDIKLIFK